MGNAEKKLSALIEELEDQRRNVRAKANLVKVELLDGWDKVEELYAEEKNALSIKAELLKLNLLDGWDKVVEKLEEHKPDKNELRARIQLAKVEALEQWDEVEEKFENLKSKSESLVGASEEKFQAGWKAGKHLGAEIKALLKGIGSKQG